MQTRSPLPPGPEEPPFLQAMRFGRDPYAYLEDCVRRYGDVFTLRLPGDPPRVVSSDPAIVRQIFALKPDDYAQGKQSFPMNIGENSLLFLDGDRHHRERQLMMPHLHGERLRSYAASMCACTDRVVDRWKPGAELAIHSELQDITLDVILRCVFGAEDDKRAARIRGPLLTWLNGAMTPALFFASALLNANRVRAMLDTVVRRRLAGGPVPRRPLLPWEKWGAAKAEVLEYLREDVERCRKEGTAGRSDVLALLSEARYEDGGLMDMEHVQDELVTLLVGGHETTANSLTWALWHVLSRPEVLAEIRAERKRVFGDNPFDPARAGELVYLDACIKEAMRITPIAPAVGRHLRRPMRIREYEIPSDTIVWACVALAHRRTDTWGDPARFRPERFLEPGAAPTNHFFPFGGGRRTCLGMAFAGVEMRIVLGRILERVELRITPGSNAQAEIRGITITPSKALEISVERRLPSRSS
ncbi:cytochrome P450 [Polyangium jinanense]|uniref:Cytochrome P450 n=1 Tax=Polyangium jinanense TaxID=2829994 RepID=A0A9X3XGA2_9BACT|nr:cytochrome P450 [Polyangium jinanense]MDC3961046.1 cytochrome P450 [Polyangium jinanense]MDC3987466.1 cytochrome P450 [Polyangium jinanense]